MGHLYSAVLADAHARWKVIKRKINYKIKLVTENYYFNYQSGEHNEVVFLTGTDEHGYKVQKKAKLENKDCKLFCDNISSILIINFDFQ